MHALAPPLWQDIGIASIGANLLAQEEHTRWAAQETQVSKVCSLSPNLPTVSSVAAMHALALSLWPKGKSIRFTAEKTTLHKRKYNKR